MMFIASLGDVHACEIVSKSLIINKKGSFVKRSLGKGKKELA
jgi:hypothetical protein